MEIEMEIRMEETGLQKCYMCHVNETRHFAGICFACADGEIEETVPNQQYTTLFGDYDSYNNEETVNKMPITLNLAGNTKNKDTKRGERVRQGWEIITMLYRTHGYFTRSMLVDATKNKSESIALYWLGVFRKYIECYPNPADKRKYQWKILVGYENLPFSEVKPQYGKHLWKSSGSNNNNNNRGIGSK